MKFFIFILLILAIVVIVIYYEQKLKILQHQLKSERANNINLANKLSCCLKKKIKFSAPNYSSGILKENIKLFLCPIKNSFVISKHSPMIEVIILDECLIDECIWYYVNIPSDYPFNCRGWVQSADFKCLNPKNNKIEN